MKKEELTMTTLSYERMGSAGVDAARRSDGILAGLKRRIRRQALHRELMRLDDRLLADIGLNRSDIAAVAHRAAEEPAPECVTERQSGFGLVGRMIESVRETLRRGRVRAELMALDDRLLADIGLTRGDIPAVLGGSERGSLREEIDSLVRPFQLWQRSREAARVLNTLDDRALLDAGMLRADIPCVASKLAERSLTPANNNGQTRAA
jgi:uncharacterized protein YjiS (DUF1127 family)